MATASKIRDAEIMLQDLMLCEQTFDIPGNFRAKQRRVKHDESKQVFPLPKKNKQPESFKTHYHKNFQRKKDARPSSPRPCSPTRRNNPHPSKNFLSWRIPTRVFDYGKGRDTNVSLLKTNVNDTYQSFYDDYAGKRVAPEVDPKLLLEIAKSYSTPTQKKDRRLNASYDLRKPKPDRKKDELTLPNVLRHSWSPRQSSFGIPDKSEKGRKMLSPIFMKPEFQPLFQSWYDAASEKEKEDTDKAFVEAEKKYIEEALSLALKPDAVKAIEQWLSDADEEEREIAMQFIKAIILASVEQGDGEQPDSPPDTPIQRHPNMRAVAGNFNLTQPNTIHHSHSSKKACEVCQKQNLQAALQQLQAVASMPMEVPGITELLNPLHPAVIAEKQSRKFPQAGRHLSRPRHQRPVFNANKGSLFVTSKKHKARHFTIHPEWF